MSRTIFVTVSDDRHGRKGGKYEKTQSHIHTFLKENKSFGVTDHLAITFKDYSQSSEFKNNFDSQSDIRPHVNGRAYKPYAIREALRKINDDDFLIYNDCSPEIWGDVANGTYKKISSIFKLEVLKEMCVCNRDILTPYNIAGKKGFVDPKYNEHTHRFYTLSKCIKTMGFEEYENCFQHASGLIVLRKCDKSVTFVDNWLRWNLVPECASLDPAWAVEAEAYGGYKKGHRHDQSISGLLVNQLGLNLVNTYDVAHRMTTFRNWCFLSLCIRDHQYRFVNSNLYK